MNANFAKQIVAMILVAFAGTPLAREPEPAVAVKTQGLPPHVAAKVKEKAAQGSTALRQYVTNTRMVNELDFRSLLREGSAPNIALDLRARKPAQVAGASAGER